MQLLYLCNKEECNINLVRVTAAGPIKLMWVPEKHMLMRANKLETMLSRDRLAYSGSTMSFTCNVHVCTTQKNVMSPQELHTLLATSLRFHVFPDGLTMVRALWSNSR